MAVNEDTLFALQRYNLWRNDTLPHGWQWNWEKVYRQHQELIDRATARIAELFGVMEYHLTHTAPLLIPQTEYMKRYTLRRPGIPDVRVLKTQEGYIRENQQGVDLTFEEIYSGKIKYMLDYEWNIEPSQEEE